MRIRATGLFIAVGLAGLIGLWLIRDRIFFTFYATEVAKSAALEGESTYWTGVKLIWSSDFVIPAKSASWSTHPPLKRYPDSSECVELVLLGLAGGAILFASRRNARPYFSSGRVVLLLWCAYLAPAWFWPSLQWVTPAGKDLPSGWPNCLIYATSHAGHPQGIEPQFFADRFVLGVHLVLDAVFLIIAGWFIRPDRQVNANGQSQSVFGRLSFRPLPHGVLGNNSFTARHFNPEPIPAEHKFIGERRLDVVDEAIRMMADQKKSEYRFWRCNAETHPVRTLLLVEQQLGRGRWVWCVAELFTTGTSLYTRTHMIVPRGLHPLDFTLLHPFSGLHRAATKTSPGSGEEPGGGSAQRWFRTAGMIVFCAAFLLFAFSSDWARHGWYLMAILLVGLFVESYVTGWPPTEPTMTALQTLRIDVEGILFQAAGNVHSPTSRRR